MMDQPSPSILPGRPLFLCGGMQSSGSTLLSWCFLQRRDFDGVLDARFDQLPEPQNWAAPHAWCKVTIACFELREVADHLADEGWDVRPILLVRDVRSVFNSLIGKRYGRNGTTAEDPSLRLRCRRFLSDYRHARRVGIPIVRFEDLVASPVETLDRLCRQMGVPFSQDMLDWPKPVTDIADASHGNSTFRHSRTGGLLQTLRPLPPLNPAKIPYEDLAWLEREFAEFNREMNYPLRADRAGVQPGRAVPRFEYTRHAWRRNNRGVAGVLRRLSRKLGHSPGQTAGASAKPHWQDGRPAVQFPACPPLQPPVHGL